MNDNELPKSQVLVRVGKEISRLLPSLSATAVMYFFALAFLFLLFVLPDSTAIVLTIGARSFSISSSLLLAVIALLLLLRYRRQVLVQYKNYLQSDLELQVQIEEAQKAVIEQPNKARPTWQVASYTLERYYRRNLFQNGMVFWLSVGVIVVGFSLIVYAILLALADPLAVTIAVAGGIAGIITEVVGASCLLIFKSTVDQSLRYATILERTSTIGMALTILNTISADNNQKTEEVIAAKIEIASKLITYIPGID